MGYYKGDYYRGDPGFFSFLGRAAKGIAGAVTGVNLSRGPKTTAGAIAPQMAPALYKSLPQRAGAALARHPVMAAAGTAALGALGIAGVSRMGVHPAVAAAAAGGLPKGYHISRKTGAVVRNRHMHVTNPRALRRALRRAHGFAKLAMKTIHLVHPKKKGRFGGFKKRHKKA
jgi:hypothetical protein